MYVGTCQNKNGDCDGRAAVYIQSNASDHKMGNAFVRCIRFETIKNCVDRAQYTCWAQCPLFDRPCWGKPSTKNDPVHCVESEIFFNFFSLALSLTITITMSATLVMRNLGFVRRKISIYCILRILCTFGHRHRYYIIKTLNVACDVIQYVCDADGNGQSFGMCPVIVYQ